MSEVNLSIDDFHCRQKRIALDVHRIAGTVLSSTKQQYLLANVNCLVKIFCLRAVFDATAAVSYPYSYSFTTKALGDGSSNVKPLCPNAPHDGNNKILQLFLWAMSHLNSIIRILYNRKHLFSFQLLYFLCLLSRS